MAFETKDAGVYRAMSNEELELRRAEVVAELENPESEIGIEELRSEVALVKAEEERRKAAADLRIQSRNAVAGGAGNVVDSTASDKHEPVISFRDRTEEALSSKEYKREFCHYLTTRGAKLSSEFEQYQMRTGGSQAALADPTAGVLADAGILVPMDIRQQIISELEDRGRIYNEVTKTNQRGGITIPVGNFKMDAHWIGEKEVSDYQVIAPITDSVVFTYHQLEVRHANTLLAETISPRVYMDKYAEAAANALMDALETAILSGTGTGQPLGLLTDTRVTNTSPIAAADFTVPGWEQKVKNEIARLASGYRNGKLYIAETTWNYYIEGMTDDNGQPVARVNYGLDGQATRTIFGQRVEVLPEKYLPYFDDADADECFMFYGNLSDYVLNSNLELRADRWEDKDNNLFKSRLITIVDGKVVDPYGFVKFTKAE